VKERASTAGPFDAINVEADRVTNSVNTLVEQIMQWVRSPEFARLHKMDWDAPAQGIEELAK
jgi:hypothetical protein